MRMRNVISSLNNKKKDFIKKGFNMEICKNKKTGKTFVYLDEEDNGQLLMITPDGSVKALEPDLFTEPVEIDKEEKLKVEDQGLISNAQIAVYHQLDQH